MNATGIFNDTEVERRKRSTVREALDEFNGAHVQVMELSAMIQEEHTGQTGRSTTIVSLEKAQIETLKADFRGELIQPGDEGYEAARKVYNGMIDRHPALIVRCADVADVITAVNFGREHNILVSIWGGGHNAGGLGVCDDGLVIDLSLIRYTHVDPLGSTVRVGGGCTWADVDHATHAFGLAVSSGIISTTGVGGLTLSGALG